MKKINLVTLITVLFSLSSLIPLNLNSEEVDKGIVIIDKKPWKVSWVQEEDFWVLVAYFEKGVLKTYFNEKPPEKGFGISKNKKPLKQELEFFGGPKFSSTKFQYEQWPDGCKAYAFTFEKKFERKGQKLELGTTAIIEEVGGAEDEIRYALYKNFEEIKNKESTETQNQGYFYHKDDNPQKFSELSLDEKFAHKSLNSKLDLLEIYTDYLHLQTDAILRFMRLLEDNKDENGNLVKTSVKKLINETEFPLPAIMISNIEKLKTNLVIGNKARECIEVINKGENNEISNWFDLFSKEIYSEIEFYEKSGLEITQYKYCFDFYTKAKEFIAFQGKLLYMMNPKIFNSKEEL